MYTRVGHAFHTTFIIDSHNPILRLRFDSSLRDPPPQCCCTKKNLALPTYEQSNTSDAKDKTPMRELDCDICACGEPLSELSEREIARDFINEDGLPFGLLDISSSSPPPSRGRSFGLHNGNDNGDYGHGLDGTDLLRQRLLEHQQGGQHDRGRSGRSKSVYTPP